MRFSSLMIVALAGTTELATATPAYLIEARGSSLSTLASPKADAIYTQTKNCGMITAAACAAAGFPTAAKGTGAVAILASCAEGCVKWQRLYAASQKAKEDAKKKNDPELGQTSGPGEPSGDAAKNAEEEAKARQAAKAQEDAKVKTDSKAKEDTNAGEEEKKGPKPVDGVWNPETGKWETKASSSKAPANKTKPN